MEQQDLLVGIEEEIYLERASVGARFLNLIIDIIGYYAVTFLIGIVVGIIQQSSDSGPFFGQSVALDYAFAYAVFITYYVLFEGFTKGRTLGKLVTGTVAVKEDGTPITFKDAFVRTLCRIVPFEPFSALGGAPWHDKWSNTQVVKVKR